MTRRSLLSRMVFAILVLAAPAMADFSQPWLPDWSSEAGYTSQFWGLHAVGGAEPRQPLTPDNYNINAYGAAEAAWVTGSDVPGFGMPYVMWWDEPMGDHPAWADEVYGGMADSAQAYEPKPYGLYLDLPAVTGSGDLRVWVQYDWFEGGGAGASTVTPNVIDWGGAPATDITPVGYYSIQLGLPSPTTGSVWYRTTQVFEFSGNPGAFDVELIIDGSAPMIDSVSVTTALNADVPPIMPVPEPATLGVLGIGVLTMLRRRRNRN